MICVNVCFFPRLIRELFRFISIYACCKWRTVLILMKEKASDEKKSYGIIQQKKKCVNCMLVHFADKLTKGEQKWMKKCSNAAFLQCNVIMTCRFCDSIKRYVDVVLLLIFFYFASAVAVCSIFYIITYSNSVVFFSTESWIGCSFTVCYYNFYTFHISNGHFFSAVVIRPIAKNSVLMTTVMNIKSVQEVVHLYISRFCRYLFTGEKHWIRGTNYTVYWTQPIH